MKVFGWISLILFPVATLAEETGPKFDAAAAERFAGLALGCVAKEYPNKISHVLNSDADVAPPRTLTPAFYGCYDWHSSMSWAVLGQDFGSLVRETARALQKSLTMDNLKQMLLLAAPSGRVSSGLRSGVAAATDRGAARVGR